MNCIYLAPRASSCVTLYVKKMAGGEKKEKRGGEREERRGGGGPEGRT